jgi:hypothetical protein
MGMNGKEGAGSIASLVVLALGVAAVAGGTLALVAAPGSPLAPASTTPPGGTGPDSVTPPTVDGDLHPIFGPVGCFHPPNSGEARCSWTFEARGGESVLFAHDTAVTKGEVALNGAPVLDSAALAHADEHRVPVKLLNGTNTVDVVISEEKESGLKLVIGSKDPHDKPRPIFAGKCSIETGDPMPKTCHYAFPSPLDTGAISVGYTFGRKAAGAGVMMKEYALITLNGHVVADYADFPPPSGHFVKPIRMNIGENKLSVEVCCMEGAGVGFEIWLKAPPPPPPPPPPGDRFDGICEVKEGAQMPVYCDFSFDSRAPEGSLAAKYSFGRLAPGDSLDKEYAQISIDGYIVAGMDKFPPPYGAFEMPVKLNVGPNKLQIEMAGMAGSVVAFSILTDSPPPPPPPPPLFQGGCKMPPGQTSDEVCSYLFKSDVDHGGMLVDQFGATSGSISLNGRPVIDYLKGPGQLKLEVPLFVGENKLEIRLVPNGPDGHAVEVTIWGFSPPPPPPPPPGPLFRGECYLDSNASGPAVCPVEFKADVRAGTAVIHWKGVTDGSIMLNGKVLADTWSGAGGELKIPADLFDNNKGEIVIKGTGPAAIYLEVWAA